MNVKKIDEKTISVDRTIPVKVETTVYSYAFLKQELINTQARKDKDNLLRDAEILELTNLIASANSLGISDT